MHKTLSMLLRPRFSLLGLCFVVLFTLYLASDFFGTVARSAEEGQEWAKKLPEQSENFFLVCGILTAIATLVILHIHEKLSRRLGKKKD